MSGNRNPQIPKANNRLTMAENNELIRRSRAAIAEMLKDMDEDEDENVADKPSTDTTTAIATTAEYTPSNNSETLSVKRTRKKKYDWDLAATLLGRGYPSEIVAANLGCHRKSIFRAIRSSPILRQRIRREKDHILNEAGALLESQRLQIVDMLIKKALDGDTRVLLFLAKNLSVPSGHYGYIGEWTE